MTTTLTIDKDVILYIATTKVETFSKTELDIIAEHLTNSTVKKYLNYLLLNNIIEHANIPLPQLATEPHVYAIKQAFVKGFIGCINDLLSIEKAPQVTQESKS